MHFLLILVRVVALSALLWLAVTDVRTRRLPNGIVLLVGLLYFVDAAIAQQPLHDILFHCFAGLMALTICAVLFLLRAFGGGDAKLAMVVFLWSGTALSLPALMLISVSGMLVGFAGMAARRIDTPHATGWRSALAMFSARRGVPYGVALAFGGCVIILRGVLLTAHPLQ